MYCDMRADEGMPLLKILLFCLTHSLQQDKPHCISLLQCLNSQCWSDVGPNSGSAQQCVLWPPAGLPPALSALCSWISRFLTHLPQTAGSSGWTSCAGTVSSPPEHTQAQDKLYCMLLTKNTGRMDTLTSQSYKKMNN